MLSWMLKPEEPERPIIDHGYLDRLAANIGRQETTELLADGMLELAERLEKARSVANAGDGATLGEVLHAIAGVAGHMGLSAMSTRSAAGQRSLRDDGADTHDAVAPVLEVAQASMNALRAYCRQASIDADADAPTP